MRAVMLGGETVTRGVLRTQRGEETGDLITLGIFGAASLMMLVIGGSDLGSVATAVLIAAVGLAVCVPWQFVSMFTEGRSLRGWIGVRVGYWWRTRHDLTAFEPSEDVPVPSTIGSLVSTDEEVDGTAIGVTEPYRAIDRGHGRYFVTAVEVQGDPYRVHNDQGEAWSAFLEYLGSEDSLISHVSTVASVTDWDATDHVWLTQNDLARVSDPSSTLVSSYAQVIDRVQEIAANQRTWLVFRFPVTHQLREGGGTDDEMRNTAAEQTMAAVERGSSLGLLARPLTSRGLGALCRHLMDPEVSADDQHGVGEDGNAWMGAFPSFTTSKDRKALVVDGVLGRRWMSVWEVPAWSVASEWLPADFLYPSVTALSGHVNRTFVVTCEIVPTRKARAKAKEDVTSDRSALGQDGAKITDGMNESQAQASLVRLEDLKGNSSVVGVNWSMVVAFHSKSERQHRQFERRMLGALSDSSIERPMRLRYRQDVALGLVMPFSRSWRKSLAERI